MKFIESEFEGYIILAEEEDLKKPLDLPELKGSWSEIHWEGVSKREGHYHAVYLTNNEFALEFLFPDEDWLGSELRERLEEHLI